MSMVRVSSQSSSRATDGPVEGPGPRLACAIAFAACAFVLAFVGKALLPVINEGDDLQMLLIGWAVGGFHGGWAMRRGLGKPGAKGLWTAALTAGLCLALCALAPTLIAAAWIWHGGTTLIFASGVNMVGENPASLIVTALVDGFKLAAAPMLALPYGAPLIFGGAMAMVMHMVLPAREG